MEYLVKIMPQAEQELEDIAYFIALDNPVRAETFVRELVKSFNSTLSVFPESGTVYRGNIRKLTHKGYTAFYRVKKITLLVEILHIVNLRKPLSARNINF